MARAKIPWPPVIPPRLQNKLKPFTIYVGGWCRWYRGRSVHIGAKSILPEQVEDRWHEVKTRIDKQEERIRAGKISEAARRDNAATLREGLSDYLFYIENRVKSGKPTPMSPVTAADVKRQLGKFARAVGPDRLMIDLAQPDFTAYAIRFNANAPSTLCRIVAYIQAFFSYCVDEGILDRPPRYGRFFVKPSMQQRRDHRMAQVKAYTLDELVKLWQLADVELRAWMTLGICGALDNADLAHLTSDVIDRQTGIIDYRRRKEGKVRRVIPLPADAWAMIDAYQRPKPAQNELSDRLFLTPSGLALQRIVENPESGNANSIDYVAFKWSKLMIRAGLKAPMPPKRKPGDTQPRSRRLKAVGSGGGRGFRALRTYFANAVPTGFGEERAIVMGHSKGTAGTVLVENYLERVGIDRIRELVATIWAEFQTAIKSTGVTPAPASK